MNLIFLDYGINVYLKLNRIFVIVFTSLLILGSSLVAQVKTNLEVIDQLVEKTVIGISDALPGDSKNLEFIYYSSEEMKLLKSNFISSFNENEYRLNTSGSNNSIILELTLNTADVDYTDTFRDGLFGNYLVERKIDLNGSYFISVNGKISDVIKFENSSLDTLDYEFIQTAENRTLPFTQSELPAEPFFSSLLEPAIAIGAAAVTIYLFFTVRSK
ncbi:MAG: hypothetical protein D8M61_04725 [Ignavibacteriae bacterium]|nr:hypothetical protein [Ignavibacteriota bacterium]